MKKIVILTQEYPYGNGEGFLSGELNFYSGKNIEVIIVPFKGGGIARIMPPGVSVFEDTHSWKGWLSVIKQIITKNWFWIEVLTNLHHLLFSAARKSFLFSLKEAFVIKEKLLALHKKRSAEDWILYSYWLGGLTKGAILFNQEISSSYKIVSRAHGGDVYAYRYKPQYIPFRHFVFENANYIAVVSQDGTDYLKAKYPESSQKINCHYLGTSEPGFICEASTDGIFRVVSCSFVVPVKRLHLIVEALELFQTKYPSVRVDWTHLGGGPQIDDLITQCAALTKSVTCHFPGTLTPQQIMTFYRTNTVDLFMNTSSSEGMPVSIMEAMSVGIPVLATNVGGVKELVNDQCGKLMPADVSPKDIAEDLYQLKSNRNTNQRKYAVSRWKELFLDVRNYETFLHAIR